MSTDAHEVEWIVPRRRLAEARALAGERLACKRMVAAERNLAAGACAPHVDVYGSLPDPPRPALADREQICPRAPAQPLNPGVADLDPAAFERAFRSAAGWQRVGSMSEPGVAIFARGDVQVRVTARDMIHACTGAAETDTLLDTEHLLEPEALPRRMMSATSAVLVAWTPTPRPPDALERQRLVMWLAGRCRVTVEPVGWQLDEQVLATAGQTVDVAQLEAPCAQR